MDLRTFWENFESIAEAPNGIAKLRSLILDLAVRGKLVPQTPEDEPAEKLLARIQEQKELSKTVKNLGDKKLEDNSEYEPFEIPSSWIWTNLESVSSYIQRGKSPKYADSGKVLVVSQKCVQWTGFDITKARFIQDETVESYSFERFLQPGDILWNSTGTGTVGRLSIFSNLLQGNQVVADSHVTVIRIIDCLPNFVYCWLSSSHIQDFIDEKTSGTTKQKELNTLTVRNELLPLPPLAEQKRIVEKVDELMGLCDRLQAAQEARDTLRQTLRKSAIDALMNAETDEDLQKSWSIVRDHWQALTQKPEDVADLRRSILQLAVRGRLIKFINAFRRPLKKFLSFQNGYAFKSEWYEPTGVQLVRNQNISHGTLKWNDVKYVSFQRAKEFERFSLNMGDIVLSLDRPIINTGLKIARISSTDLPSLLVQRVARPLFEDKLLSAEYLFMWFNSPEFIGAIDPGRSNGVPHISTNSLEKIDILVPPLAEQKRIVAKVDELMQMCDKLEESLRQSQQHLEALTASAITHLAL